ncbi:MAG: ABC transporter permease [Bacteroidota bacterium]
MLRFLLRRLGSGLLVIWGIVTLLYAIFHLQGNPAEMMVGENTDAETKAAIERAYHLDRPPFQQYLFYLHDLSPIGVLSYDDPDLGGQRYVKLFSTGGTDFLALKQPWFRRSFQSNKRVSELLAEKLPGTIILAVSAMLIACLLGIPLGIWSALQKERFSDRLITFLTLLGISAPSFFMAVIIIRIFAVNWGDWTHFNISGYLFEERIFADGYTVHWRNLVLPALALGIRPLSIITQLTRASMIEVLGADYIRTARAKGLKSRVIVLRHALQNALNPVLTSISGWFASLLAGAFFIETIFDWQGLGKLTIDALTANDYPVILGAAILIGITFVLINILVDILYTRLDPRVRLA